MNRDPINTENQDDLLVQLQLLLEKQVETLKNSNLGAVEMLAGQADLLVAEITKTRAFPQSQGKEKYDDLTRLYKKLVLMIEAEKDALNTQMLKIGSGKKTVRAYHHKT